MTQGKLNPQEKIYEFATDMCLHYNIRTLKDTKDIMIYESGIYIKGEEILHVDFKEKFTFESGPANFKTFLHHIRGGSYVDRKEFIEPENKINLENCVLDVATRETYEHSHEYNFLHKLDIKYDPNAKCLEIEKFLHSIVESEDDYNCLVEMIGYTLMSGYKFHKLLILFGFGGHNGKSTYIKLIETMLNGNCSHISIQDLSSNRFSAAHLYGKKANLCADLPRSAVENTGIIKQLTGEDTFHADIKNNQNGIDFSNTAKAIFSCNELPDIKDGSPAMWNRIILINFPNEFRGDKENKNLIEKLTTDEELSGLINLALDGIERLMKNGKFTYNHETTPDRWEEFRNLHNPIDAFWKDCVIRDVNSWVSKTNLYNLYELYCSIKDLNPLSYNKFARYVNKYLNQDKRFTPKGEDRIQHQAWNGISIRDPWQYEWNKHRILVASTC